ncbi:hypothetical protein [Micromonospora sp. PLK6-60]|uniref:hypothetical protein n=1 Tax=Micromonospora sp. PLK6-60 TaxID=2873383 RepID=UPI00210614A2|nr:hypothetical protein [Micromonospora sp. PLK6-60]
MLRSIRLPEPTLILASKRSLKENDNSVAFRTGPVPFGTDGAAPSAVAVRAALPLSGVSNNHTSDVDFGDRTGSPTPSRPAGRGAATAAAFTPGTASTEAASSAQAIPPVTFR